MTGIRYLIDWCFELLVAKVIGPTWNDNEIQHNTASIRAVSALYISASPIMKSEQRDEAKAHAIERILTHAKSS